jgi:hypothetical protein
LGFSRSRSVIVGGGTGLSCYRALPPRSWRTSLTHAMASEHGITSGVKCGTVMTTRDPGGINRRNGAQFVERVRRFQLSKANPMKELLRTNDTVRLSWAQAVLAGAGIDSLVLDHHTSLVEGSIGAIPRRLMVAEHDHRRAGELIAAAEAELQ